MSASTFAKTRWFGGFRNSQKWDVLKSQLATQFTIHKDYRAKQLLSCCTEILKITARYSISCRKRLESWLLRISMQQDSSSIDGGGEESASAEILKGHFRVIFYRKIGSELTFGEFLCNRTAQRWRMQAHACVCKTDPYLRKKALYLRTKALYLRKRALRAGFARCTRGCRRQFVRRHSWRFDAPWRHSRYTSTKVGLLLNWLI